MANKTWTKEEIKTLLEQNDRAVERGLVAIYNRQTEDEQFAQTTSHHNGRGFNGIDASFGSKLAEVVLKGWHLSPKQVACARRILRKYAGQLLAVAQAKEEAAISPSDYDSVVNTEEAAVA